MAYHVTGGLGTTGRDEVTSLNKLCKCKCQGILLAKKCGGSTHVMTIYFRIMIYLKSLVDWRITIKLLLCKSQDAPTCCFSWLGMCWIRAHCLLSSLQNSILSLSGKLRLLYEHLSFLMKNKWYTRSPNQPEERARSNQESMSLMIDSTGQCPLLELLQFRFNCPSVIYQAEHNSLAINTFQNKQILKLFSPNKWRLHA